MPEDVVGDGVGEGEGDGDGVGCTVGDGDGVGCTVGVCVGVGCTGVCVGVDDLVGDGLIPVVGDGVVAGVGVTVFTPVAGIKVKVKFALREPEFSLACKICVPVGQLLCATTSASKVPTMLTATVPPEATCFCICTLINMGAASSASAAPDPALIDATCMGCDLSRVTGWPLSIVSVTFPPGRKPFP